MKVSARVIGSGFARAETLVNDIRRRVLDRLAARRLNGSEPARQPDATPNTQRTR